MKYFMLMVSCSLFLFTTKIDCMLTQLAKTSSAQQMRFITTITHAGNYGKITCKNRMIAEAHQAADSYQMEKAVMLMEKGKKYHVYHQDPNFKYLEDAVIAGDDTKVQKFLSDRCPNKK